MARKTKKFHRIKSTKAINAIRARRKAAKVRKIGPPYQPVDSKTLLPTVNING